MSTAAVAARQRLLDAASVRFRRFGFRHASVESITDAAGTAKGSLYLHYSSKEDLYLDAVRQAVEGFLAEATIAMEAVDSAPARMRALVEFAIEHYQDDELLSAPLLGDRDLVTPGAAALARELQRRRITELIESTLSEGQRDGSIRVEIDAATTAVVLFESGWAIVGSHLTGELPLPLGDALTALNVLVGRGTLVDRSMA
jgi:AcrR family transcriptional regulator